MTESHERPKDAVSKKVPRATAVCILGFGLAACVGLFGPRWGSRIGIIVDGSIVVPDTASVGANFVVTFTTSGGGCTKAGWTETRLLDSLTAEIRPYDYYQIDPSACTANLAHFPHAAPVQFGRSGTAAVRVIGAYNDSTITTTRTVIVR